MSKIGTITAPEDTITQMARRAFTEFRKAEMAAGGKMRDWDDPALPIRVKVIWKQIVGEALGKKGTMVNVNPNLRDPHTLVITGLSDSMAASMRAGIESKLGGTPEKPAMKYSDKAFHSPTNELVQLDGESDSDYQVRVEAAGLG